MPVRMLPVIYTMFVLCLAQLSPALAEEADETAQRADSSESMEAGEEAAIASSRARFSAAVELVDQGRHHEALELFHELQDERPHAILLYNIGLCLSRLDRVDEAIEVLGDYLEQGDANAERLIAARTERDRLVELASPSPTTGERGASSPDTVRPDEPSLPREDTQVASERDDRRRLRPAWFWTVLGITATTGAALAVTGGITIHLSDQWLEEGNIDDRDRGRVLQNVSDGLLISLVCMSITTLVLGLFTDYGDSRRQRQVALLTW